MSGTCARLRALFEGITPPVEIGAAMTDTGHPANGRLIAIGGRYRQGEEWVAGGAVRAYNTRAGNWIELLAAE